MMWSASALTLLAQASAPTPVGVTPADLQEAIRTVIIIMVMGAIPVVITCINGVLNIFDRFKAKPPLHKEYATKAETAEMDRRHKVTCEDLEKRIAGEVRELKAELTDFTNKTERHRDGLNTELKSIARQMGEIAGRLGCRVPRRVASDSQHD